jgi:hypothetical protein
MAKGKKTGGKDFPRGESGNPNGRPVLPPEVKALKSVTNETIKEVMDLLLEKDITALEELAESDTEPALKVLYAAGVLRAIKEGDPAHIEPVLNRVLGKPKESVQLSGDKENPVEVKHSLTVLERIEQLKGK